MSDTILTFISIVLAIFHSLRLSESLSLSLCLSLLVCQHDVTFIIYLNVCYEG